MTTDQRREHREPQVGDVIFAYDPGVSTGAAAAQVIRTGPAEEDLDIDVIRVWQFKDDGMGHVYTACHLDDLIGPYYGKGLHLVAERFDLRPGNKFLADLTPVKVNAVMDFMMADEKPPPIVYQTPAQAKSFCPDARLKQLGLWPTGRTVGQPDADDARDALRHLIRYAAVELRLRGLLKRIAE